MPQYLGQIQTFEVGFAAFYFSRINNEPFFWCQTPERDVFWVIRLPSEKCLKHLTNFTSDFHGSAFAL